MDALINPNFRRLFSISTVNNRASFALTSDDFLELLLAAFSFDQE